LSLKALAQIHGGPIYLYLYILFARITSYNREYIIIKGVFRLRGENFAVSYQMQLQYGLETAG
jgi:hypothetical protein